MTEIDQALISECIHCGFCLPTCPTYVLWHEEMDSPRGRIHLMDARLDGTIALNATVAQHFDRCLGCMACLSSCPSGVRYDRLIESTRAAVEEELDRPLSDRLVRGLLFRLLPYPGRMRAALRHAARSPNDASDSTFSLGDLHVDLAGRQVLIGGKSVHLTPIEYRLLTTLIRHAGKVMTQRQLLKEVWGLHSTDQAHYLRVYIAQLRRKLEADSARPRYLLTEPGVGYRLAAE